MRNVKIDLSKDLTDVDIYIFSDEHIGDPHSNIEYLKEKGFWVVGTDMDGEDYTKIKYPKKTALVIGSEGFGMTRIVKESCDFIASIPMHGKVNSLNASVAAGIMIYEVIKR